MTSHYDFQRLDTGQGDGSVYEALSLPVQGAEFCAHSPCCKSWMWWDAFLIPTLGKWRKVCLWSLLLSSRPTKTLLKRKKSRTMSEEQHTRLTSDLHMNKHRCALFSLCLSSRSSLSPLSTLSCIFLSPRSLTHMPTCPPPHGKDFTCLQVRVT